MRLERRGSRGSLQAVSFARSTAHTRRTTSENLIAPFAAQYHLDSHGLDLSAEKVHRCACSHGGDVVCFKMIYDIWNRVQAFLDGKYVFMMDSAEVVSRLSGSKKVRRMLEANRKGV